MRAYIEENAWASCTFDLAGSPRQLQKQCDRRAVGYVQQDRLLTIGDRATAEKFTCKLTAKQWGGLLSLIGGIAVGAAVVLSGPVGWIALGAVVVVAIGTTVAVCLHDCSEPLKAGEWVMFRTTVRIGGKNALLYNHSLLKCNNGGVLIASETEAAAQAVSDAMKWNARAEVAVQILSNAVVGFIVGVGVKDSDGDYDLAAPFLAVGAYYYTDFEQARNKDFTPEKSFLVSLSASALGYGIGYMDRIPGMGFMKWFGTELGPVDVATTLLSLGVGYGGDKLEEYLAKRNDEVIKGAAGSSGSGKSIVGAED